jgi:hypothetical protein
MVNQQLWQENMKWIFLQQLWSDCIHPWAASTFIIAEEEEAISA